MDLRNKLPGDTFQYIVTTDGTHLYDGTGSLMTSLTITSITSSQVTQSFVSESFAKVDNLSTTNLTASKIKFGFILSDPTDPANDVAVYTTGSVFAVSSSFGPGNEAGFGNGICFADFGFQSLGGIGFLDATQTTGRVATWGASQSVSGSKVLVTELDNVSGITGSIQSQLNGKQNTIISGSSLLITSSYLIGSTASTAPSNTATPVAWLNVTVSGSIYKLPLYQ